ncbi:S8 family serine peptidase [Halomicroarcula sp. GCM10025709]|uniref:PKD domain-containing protein n=1 Tax=Halomicroarcula sp. GCM10025709 TaxID=3252669 RepID=UPI00361A0AAA
MAAEDNNRGVVGVAPTADLYAIKVLNSTGVGYYSWWVSGIDAALKGPDGTMGTDDDADVLSMSLGGASDASNLRNAIADASDRAVIVASAGNSGDGDPATNEVGYPAKYSGAIAVAATDRNDQTTTFSAEGSEIELAAPGSGQDTTGIGGGTVYFGGTSAAAPHVAGAAALVIAQDLEDGSRDLSESAVRQRLQDTALDIEASGRDNEAGYGLVQADRALSVGNSPPTADAGSDISVTGGSSVTLDATGSTDPDGESLIYSWSQTGGTAVSLGSPNTATPTFTAPSVNSQTTLTFEVTVTDGNGGWGTDTVAVTVSPSNSVPTADAGSDVSVNGGAPVTLDATGSTDPDGDVLSYFWTQTGGTAVSLGSSNTATPTFTAPGVNSQTTLTFEVSVTDPSGASDTDTVAVTVSPSNNAPTADAGSDISVTGGSSVTLDATGSTDPDGESLIYSWSQTGGTAVSLGSPNTATPTFTAPSVNSQTTLTFELTVTDANGGWGTDTVAVTVSPSNTAPTADAGSNMSVTVGSSVTLDGSQSTDPDGDALSYTWSQTGGTAVVLTGPTTAQPTFTAPSVSSPTTLDFELVVRDASASSTDTVAVTVQPSQSASSRFDIDSDGTVDRGDVLDVIAAYNTGSTVGGSPVDGDDVMRAIVELNT